MSSSPMLCGDVGLLHWITAVKCFKWQLCCPQLWLRWWWGQLHNQGRQETGTSLWERNPKQWRKWSLINASAVQKMDSDCPLFLYLWLCNVDLITAVWTQQISSLRTVENIDALFTKNFWEACCTYVSTTTCLDGFYLIGFWKAYGENFCFGAFNLEMCRACRNKLWGVTMLLYPDKACLCRQVYLGSGFIITSGACGWIAPCWRVQPDGGKALCRTCVF